MKTFILNFILLIMKTIFILPILFIILSACHTPKFKYKNNDITYCHIIQKAMTGNAEKDTLLQKLSAGTDSIKVKIISRIFLRQFKMNYYELEFYDINGNSIRFKHNNTGLFMNNISMIPENLLY